MDFSSTLDQAVLSVSAVHRRIRDLLQGSGLNNIWVTGEISNLSQPTSGHIYFTLKDADSGLRCVIWRSQSARMLVHLRNGLAVEAHGDISIYERDGTCQLYVDGLRHAGEGRLYQEFLRLKALLETEGLFDPERRKEIPARPRHIGIVTSPTGAALQDMLNTLRRRYPIAQVTLVPAQVQGIEAPAAVIRALATLIRQDPDVILVARGGGSLEDLWAFNDEHVVRAIAASPIPVITGIGHEIDFTLADFAADLRAPTPTAAAELATPAREELKSETALMLEQVRGYTAATVNNLRQTLHFSQHRLASLSPVRRVQDSRQRLDTSTISLHRSLVQQLRHLRADLHGRQNRLISLDPQAVLERGYTLIRDEHGNLVTSIGQMQPPVNVRVIWHDGQADAVINSTHRMKGHP